MNLTVLSISGKSRPRKVFLDLAVYENYSYLKLDLLYELDKVLIRNISVLSNDVQHYLRC